MLVAEKSSPHYTATRNPCKLCTPLGAALAFSGIEGALPLLHGSQGCATYIRRYLISHFKEPVDIASSNFSEQSAVFGGGDNLKQALANIRRQYDPALIGIATTCLSETIGEDVPGILREYAQQDGVGTLPPLVHVSTPSYQGTYREGFHAAVKALVTALAGAAAKKIRPLAQTINLLPGMLSPEDLRHLKAIVADFGLSAIMLPDYADRLDGAQWTEYRPIQPGGTPVAAIGQMGQAVATVQFGHVLALEPGAGQQLAQACGVPLASLGLPIGINATDAFLTALETISGRATPSAYRAERGRLVDAYVDGHKYVSQKRAIVFGEEDLVAGLAAFLAEIGLMPVLCATGGKSGRFREAIHTAAPDLAREDIRIEEGIDFKTVETLAAETEADILIGNSKGLHLARALQKPLVRVGFPIHDRFGGGRVRHIGYRGTLRLFDRIVNSLIAQRQNTSEVGYFYM